jgi:hypothetical protein
MTEYSKERFMIFKDIRDNKKEINDLEERFVEFKVQMARDGRKAGAASGGLAAMIVYVLELIFRG